MIREYDFGGVVLQQGGSREEKDARVDQLLSGAIRRTLSPGSYDITPVDTRYCSYESQTLQVFPQGHAKIMGRRKPQSVGTGILLTEVVDNSQHVVILQPHVAEPTADELIATIDSSFPIQLLTTVDGDHFLRTQEMRRLLWKIYRYTPGEYSVSH